MIIATPNRNSNATHDLPTPHRSGPHHTNTNTNADDACFSCDLQCGGCGWGRACDNPSNTVARMRDCMLLMHRHKHWPIFVHLGYTSTEQGYAVIMVMCRCGCKQGNQATACVCPTSRVSTQSWEIVGPGHGLHDLNQLRTGDFRAKS